MLLDQPIDAQAPLTQEDAEHVLSTGLWAEDPAVALVLQDTARAESYEATKSWIQGWTAASALYQSPYVPRRWPGTDVEAANVPFFTVATAVNALTPQVVNGLFFENPPFMINERPGTRAQAARAIGALLSYQLEDINFRESIRLGVFSCLLYGTAIWQYGYECYKRERKEYRRKSQAVSLPSPIDGAKPTRIYGEDSIEEVMVEEYIDRPTFEHITNLRDMMVDPALDVPDVQKARYVVRRRYMTFEDLDRLRERPGFNIPPKEELLALFFPPAEQPTAEGTEAGTNPIWSAKAAPAWEDNSADPFKKPLEVLERWDAGTYIAVLQKKLCICNDQHPYGKVPFLSIGWWDSPGAFWSMGLGKTIGSEQRLQQGITNIWLDQASLNLNGVYVHVKGKSIPTQSIRVAPGRIINVDTKGDFEPLDRLPAVPEAGQHIAMSSARVNTVSGANPITSQGNAGDSGHSNMARSSAGAQLLGAGANAAPSDFVEKLANQVFVPTLYAFHEINRALLPEETIQVVLGDELQHEFMDSSEDPIIEILNARVKFSISAGAKMAARRNMAQALPIIIQYVTNQQTENQLALQAKKVDVVELMRMMWQVSDWNNFKDVVVDMTPEDKQRWEQMQNGADNAKLAAQSALLKQQGDQKSQLVDQENIARAGREVMRTAIEKAADGPEVTGAPDGSGFGSNA